MAIADNIRHEMGLKGRRRDGADNDTTRRALHVGGSNTRNDNDNNNTSRCGAEYIWNSIGAVGHSWVPCVANTIRMRSVCRYTFVSASDTIATTTTNTTTHATTAAIA